MEIFLESAVLEMGKNSELLIEHPTEMQEVTNLGGIKMV